VLQRVAACCSVLQRVAACCSVLQRVAACCSVLRCDAMCFSVLQCVVVCCSVLQKALCNKEPIVKDRVFDSQILVILIFRYHSLWYVHTIKFLIYSNYRVRDIQTASRALHTACNIQMIRFVICSHDRVRDISTVRDIQIIKFVIFRQHRGL